MQTQKALQSSPESTAGCPRAASQRSQEGATKAISESPVDINEPRPRYERAKNEPRTSQETSEDMNERTSRDTREASRERAENEQRTSREASEWRRGMNKSERIIELVEIGGDTVEIR